MQGHCYIDGKWVAPARTFPVTDPATGTVVGEAADASVEEARRAVDAAQAAFTPWAGLSGKDRGAALKRISLAIADDLDGIADLIVNEQGKPRGQALFEVNYAREWLDWYAEEARRINGEVLTPPMAGKFHMVQRKPLGVAVAITPWNFPVAMIARKLAPALAAGCTIVVKPAEQTPLSPTALFEAIDRADVPGGVANLVTTADPVPVSEALLQDPRVRKITFTGSTEVGKILVRASADNLARVSLELGGHAPFIVFDDADLDAALAGVLASKFQVCGQSCLCANRIYVQSGVAAEFTEMLRVAVAALEVGRGDAADVAVGPLIDEQGFEKVSAQVRQARDAGARVLHGGERLSGDAYSGGFFYEPTLLVDCTDDMAIAREETFGPVAPVFTFEEESEVLARANNSRFGLAAYFYTSDLGRAMRVSQGLEYGIVGVNDATPSSATAPFGGFKESGLGREGGHDGLEAFLETKLVSIIA